MRPNAYKNLEKGICSPQKYTKKIGYSSFEEVPATNQKCLLISQKSDTGSSETFVSEAYLLIEVQEDTRDQFMTTKLI